MESRRVNFALTRWPSRRVGQTSSVRGLPGVYARKCDHHPFVACRFVDAIIDQRLPDVHWPFDIRKKLNRDEIKSSSEKRFSFPTRRPQPVDRANDVWRQCLLSHKNLIVFSTLYKRCNCEYIDRIYESYSLILLFRRNLVKSLKETRRGKPNSIYNIHSARACETWRIVIHRLPFQISHKRSLVFDDEPRRPSKITEYEFDRKMQN